MTELAGDIMSLSSEAHRAALDELVVRGDQVMQGYWRNDEATQDASAGDWFHSGDLARWDEAGNLYIVDRMKDMIITGGENVYSREVEEVLYQHPAMAEAAVVGVPDVNWGENVVACIQLRAGATATEAELIDHCRDNLAGYKKPRWLVSNRVLPEAPKTASAQDHLCGPIPAEMSRTGPSFQSFQRIFGPVRKKHQLPRWLVSNKGSMCPSGSRQRSRMPPVPRVAVPKMSQTRPTCSA